MEKIKKLDNSNLRKIDISTNGILTAKEAMDFFNKKFYFVYLNGQAFAFQENLVGYTLRKGIEAFSNKTVKIYIPIERDGETIHIPKYYNSFNYWWKNVEERYEGIEFNPEYIGHKKKYNLYKGFRVEPNQKGNCSTFLQHVKENICNNDLKLYNYLMDWAAHLIQFPHKKNRIVILLRGTKQGTGKSLFGNVLGKLLLNENVYETNSITNITKKFNIHLVNKLLVKGEEMSWGGELKNDSIFKGIITSDKIAVEGKHKDGFVAENRMRFIMTSNNSWATNVGKHDRRFFIIDVKDYKMQNKVFFDKLYNELEKESGYEKLFYTLQTWKIQTKRWEDIPITEAKTDIMYESFDPFEKWIYECLEDYHDNSDIYSYLIFSDSTKNGFTIPIDELFGKFRLYTDKNGLKITQTNCSLGKKLKSIFSIEKKRIPLENGSRPYGYIIESLDILRTKFCNHTGLPISTFNEKN